VKGGFGGNVRGLRVLEIEKEGRIVFLPWMPLISKAATKGCFERGRKREK
jgi:hypothetical protein